MNLQFCDNSNENYNNCEDGFFFVGEYNCGGYALNTKTWFVPEKRMTIPVFERYQRFGEKATLEYYTNNMLEYFDNLRRIYHEDEAKDYETIVFFRIGYDDYHFVRKEKDGKYYHKMGWCPEINEMEREEVYGNDWCDERYDSDIVMFAYNEHFELEETG